MKGSLSFGAMRNVHAVNARCLVLATCEQAAEIQQRRLVQARGATSCVCRASEIHASPLTEQDNLDEDAM